MNVNWKCLSPVDVPLASAQVNTVRMITLAPSLMSECGNDCSAGAAKGPTSSVYVPDAHNGPVAVNALAPVRKSTVSVIENGVCAPCAIPAKLMALATASM